MPVKNQTQVGTRGPPGPPLGCLDGLRFDLKELSSPPSPGSPSFPGGTFPVRPTVPLPLFSGKNFSHPLGTPSPPAIRHNEPIQARAWNAGERDEAEDEAVTAAFAAVEVNEYPLASRMAWVEMDRAAGALNSSEDARAAMDREALAGCAARGACSARTAAAGREPATDAMCRPGQRLAKRNMPARNEKEC
jgi:hypothetical protein